jgi:hypothetical protein
MTIQGLSSSYYNTGLYGSSSSSSAASAFLQLATSSTSSDSSSTSSVSQKRMPPPPSQADMEAAKQKLEEVDPDLAAKMESFNDQMKELKDSGASRETIAATMKENMESLSDTEKSELESVFGAQGSGGQGGPGGPGGPGAPAEMMSDLISQLGTTDSTLAKKLQGFEDQIQELKDSGASEEDIMAAAKTNMDSLTKTEKSEIDDAIQTLMENKSSENEESTSSSDSSISSALLQSQVYSTYLQQAQEAQYTSAFAFAA